jgi:hypothetical protein
VNVRDFSTIFFRIGRGLAAATERWTVKMIIDIPLGS